MRLGTRAASSKGDKPLPPDHNPKIQFDRRAYAAERSRRRAERLASLNPASEPDDGLERSTAVAVDDAPREKAPRMPKRKCAVLIGYSGKGFNGMQ